MFVICITGDVPELYTMGHFFAASGANVKKFALNFEHKSICRKRKFPLTFKAWY